MNKTATCSKTIYAALFAGAMLLATSSAFAQVKIGTNPTVIGTNNNLEVEAINNKKVIVNKADGTVVIENTPTGATTDKYLSIDAAGNVRALTPPTSEISKIHIGSVLSQVDIGICPAGPITVGGYFTGATCYSYYSGVYGKTILTMTFPDLGTTNYQVFTSSNYSGTAPDWANDILLPLVYNKTSNSFSLFLEKSNGSTTGGIVFSCLIVLN
ncbi:hypothetical protein [Dyadobacter diqingensis]|uniref:hypothetical protein n=1 Tax=Dyadobacter diqingensis TaxID=2938121 RepID=UPI0020C1AAA4|nr:hypothetical protein [Dyadobacter diqingensis]